MMTFQSSADLSRLQQTDTAHPVITQLATSLFSEPDDPVTVALMQPNDNDHPLSELCSAEDVTLEGIIELGDMYLVVFQTDYQYAIVLVIPDEDWLSGELRLCIEENIYN